MFVVTNREMREIDRYTIEQIGIPSIVLMENAGKSVAEWILDHCQSGAHVGVVCGKGNNGGDGFVIARHLFNKGLKVSVYIADDSESFSKDASLQYEIIQNMRIDTLNLQQRGNCLDLTECNVIVDAILGTGIEGEVRSWYQQIIKAINQAKVQRPELMVVSVDHPSGVYGDDGQISAETVRADVTLALGFIKRSQITHPACRYVGNLILLDIGIPKQAQCVAALDTFLLTEQMVGQWLPVRADDSHKGTYGRVHCIAGSTQYLGAGLLAATACLHIGAGLAYWHAPDGSQSGWNGQTPELIFIAHPSEEGHFALEGIPTLVSSAADADAVVIGCGIARFDESGRWIMELLQHIQCPVVLDADGFVMLRKQLVNFKNLQRNIVVTPHPGELATVLGISIDEVEKRRIELSKKFAEEYQVTVILKGNRTVIAVPNGNVYVNSTGSHVLAKAGAGDVLAGFIGGLLAQGLSPENAACVAVYCHGKAAEQLAEQTYVSTMASDVSRNIGAVLRNIAIHA